jgi:hypothetical protein
MYFSTFERTINLTPDSIMQLAGAPMLYDLDSNHCLPCLYICPRERAGALPSHPVFHRLLHIGLWVSWKPLCRHAAGPGKQQQALKCEHHVALWPGQSPDGVHCRG